MDMKKENQEEIPVISNGVINLRLMSEIEWDTFICELENDIYNYYKATRPVKIPKIRKRSQKANKNKKK